MNLLRKYFQSLNPPWKSVNSPPSFEFSAVCNAHTLDRRPGPFCCKGSMVMAWPLNNRTPRRHLPWRRRGKRKAFWARITIPCDRRSILARPHPSVEYRRYKRLRGSATAFDGIGPCVVALSGVVKFGIPSFDTFDAHRVQPFPWRAFRSRLAADPLRTFKGVGQPAPAALTAPPDRRIRSMCSTIWPAVRIC